MRAWLPGFRSSRGRTRFLTEHRLTKRLSGIAVFDDEGELRRAVEQVLDTGKWSPPGWEEIVSLADPFRDGQAIERLRAIVLGKRDGAWELQK